MHATSFHNKQKPMQNSISQMSLISHRLILYVSNPNATVSRYKSPSTSILRFTSPPNMASSTFSLSLITFLIAALHFHSSAPLIAGEHQESLWQNLQQQQQHRLRARTDCRVDHLTAQEPTLRFDSEAGRTEFWDQNNQQFECAGVAAVRNYIEPRGLLLPHYNNAPQILYVVRG